MKKMLSCGCLTLAALLISVGQSGTSQTKARLPAATIDHRSVDWPVYGGDKGNDHYSPLTQINKRNVSALKVAWIYDTEERGGLQTSPLTVGKVLYAVSPTQRIIALDGATGMLVWSFDSGIKGTQPNRGLAWWQEGKEKRLFVGILNYLYALNPDTGRPIATFGERGRIDLRKNLRGDYTQLSVALTSPGVVYRNLIIVGGRNPETHPSPPGDIRAFDVRSGALRWVFHTIPHPGEPGYETWPKEAWLRSGAANNWGGMALDEKRGIVYVPTGSPVDDFYGSDRIGNNLFANSLLALDARTGKLIWHFQAVHHDIWDRDFPAAPSLFTITRNGAKTDGIAQISKQGYVYLFDRVTGKPLFPISEEPVPVSLVPGEQAAVTQPIPSVPEPFARQVLTEQMLTNRTPEAHRFALEQFRLFRSEGQFTPLNVDTQTIVFPGFDGGGEWGGAAIDRRVGIIYVNANEMAWTGGLTNRAANSPGARVYMNLCAACHGEHREGSPPAFPSLVGVSERRSDQRNRAKRQGEDARISNIERREASEVVDELLEV